MPVKPGDIIYRDWGSGYFSFGVVGEQVFDNYFTGMSVQSSRDGDIVGVTCHKFNGFENWTVLPKPEVPDETVQSVEPIQGGPEGLPADSGAGSPAGNEQGS